MIQLFNKNWPPIFIPEVLLLNTYMSKQNLVPFCHFFSPGSKNFWNARRWRSPRLCRWSRRHGNVISRQNRTKLNITTICRENRRRISLPEEDNNKGTNRIDFHGVDIFSKSFLFLFSLKNLFSFNPSQTGLWIGSESLLQMTVWHIGAILT